MILDVASTLEFDTCWESSGEKFLRSWQTENVDIVVLDLVMPDVDGIEIIQSLAGTGWQGSIVITSGYDGKYIEVAKTLAKAKGLQLAGILKKPFEITELIDMLGR